MRRMQMSRAPADVASRLAVAALALTLTTPARAHVAPAIGDNNRYLKLTPLGDRVRLAYTVFYGELPGAELRRAIDTNRDGSIGDAESQAFGKKVAGEIAPAVVMTIDGAARPVAWSQVVVGLGTPQVAAGAFSIDLVAWFCLPAPRARHTVLLRDHYPLARPGETEVKVDDSPGVTIHDTRIGGAVDEAHDYKLVGPSGALDTAGLDLQFTAGPAAPVTSDAICRRGGPARTASTGVIVGATLAGIIALGGLVTVRWRRRRQVRARPPARR